MRKSIIFLMLISIVFLASCESNTYDQISLPVTNLTYVANIKPVIAANCTGCHSAGDQSPALETYDQLKTAIVNGKVLCKIEGSCGSIMPTSGKMPQGTIDMIKLWATNGFVN
jgi:hypothetical protein